MSDIILSYLDCKHIVHSIPKVLRLFLDNLQFDDNLKQTSILLDYDTIKSDGGSGGMGRGALARYLR